MRYFVSSILILVSGLAMADEKIDKTLAVESGGTVNISIPSGDIEVVAWDKSEVRVTGELSKPTKNFIFESSGAETNIEVKTKNGKHRSWGGGSDADLKIYVPAASAVVCNSMSADIDLQGVLGGVKASTFSGDIEVMEVERNINLETVSGDIVISEATAILDLTSVSGDIRASAVANQFDANTVSGDIDAELGAPERIELATVSGDIDLSSGLANGGRMDIETVSGDVELDFGDAPINASFVIETGPGGEINNSLSDDSAGSQSGSFINSEELWFKLGNGSGSVSMDTMSGTITLDN